MRREEITWPRLVEPADKADVCEAEITEIHRDLGEMREMQEVECQRLRERIEALEARVPARSWLGALMACVRAQRYGRHP